MEKFGEINLSTLIGTLTLLSTSHPSRFASTSSLGPGATVGLGLGLGWGGAGALLGCAGPGVGWGRCWTRMEPGLELGWPSHFSLRVEGLGSHCDVIRELHSYRMISEALGTQLAEITDRVLSHWLPTSQSEAERAERRGGESE